MELISCAISTVDNVRNPYAFSTCGVLAFLTLQNAIITLQLLHYQPTLTARDSNRPKVLGAGISMLISYRQTTPNRRQREEVHGNALCPVVIANVVGCLARVFTATTEVQDPLVLWGFILSSVLNVVIGVQLWAYWGNIAKGKGDYRLPTEKVKVVSANGVELHAPKAVRPLYTANLGCPEPGRRTPPAYSPARGSPAPGGGRRWTRKVD
ncbi:hypothetical protein FRC04_007203 [Tulasnella sp. 424]|nr:hypothetical protein FRC04_007203 [Tulasnella sp. 424]